jgi:hypothetical protein
MKKQTSVIALGALMSLAMTATSFAASAHPAKRAIATYPRYYDYVPGSYNYVPGHYTYSPGLYDYSPGSYNPAVPEGNYTTFYPAFNSDNGGSVSSAIGNIGH